MQKICKIRLKVKKNEPDENTFIALALVLIVIMIIPVVSAAEQSKDAVIFQLPQLQFNDSQEQVIIQNGFGFTQGDGRYQIPEGSIIYHSSDGITRVFDPYGKQLLMANDADSKKIRNSPSTKYLQVPNGSFIKENENSTQVFLNERLISTIIYEKTNTSIVKLTDQNQLMDQELPGGWIEASNYTSVNNLREFSAEWTVPSKPPIPSTSAQIAFFNAIQPNIVGPGRNSSIIQPVLEWSYYNHWFGFVEYHNSYGQQFDSVNINGTINSGDTIWGTMTWVSSQSRWGIRIFDENTNKFESIISVQAPEIGTTDLSVYCALEGYHIQRNSDLPGPTTFSNIYLKDSNGNNITFNWNRWISYEAQTLLHGLAVDTPSQSLVTLYTNPRATIGVFRNGVWYLRNSNTNGPADLTFTFGQSGDKPVVGDWNGDGTDTIGVFRNGSFFLRNSNTNGAPDLSFIFGQTGDVPVIGDWNGDGTDTIGVFRNGMFYLRNSNTNGVPDLSFIFGQAGDIPVVGDWNGDGTDTIGVFRNGTFFLRNSNTNGAPDLSFIFGQAGDKPVAGDWNGDGIDTIGVFRNGMFYLRNSNTGGNADITFGYGMPSDIPVVGDWI